LRRIFYLLKFVILGTFLGDETRILSDIRQTIKGRKKKKDKMKGKCGKQNMVGIGGVVAVLGTLGKESKDIFKKYKFAEYQIIFLFHLRERSLKLQILINYIFARCIS
jgi:hypothetical protein